MVVADNNEWTNSHRIRTKGGKFSGYINYYGSLAEPTCATSNPQYQFNLQQSYVAECP
jgi:hypothetical protein